MNDKFVFDLGGAPKHKAVQKPNSQSFQQQCCKKKKKKHKHHHASCNNTSNNPSNTVVSNPSSQSSITDGFYFLDVNLQKKEGRLQKGFLIKKDIYSGSLHLHASGGEITSLKAYYRDQSGKKVYIVNTKQCGTYNFIVPYKDIGNTSHLDITCIAEIKSRLLRARKHLERIVSIAI